MKQINILFYNALIVSKLIVYAILLENYVSTLSDKGERHYKTKGSTFRTPIFNLK